MINNIFNIITGLFLSKITVLLIDAIAVYLAVVVYFMNFRKTWKKFIKQLLSAGEWAG